MGVLSRIFNRETRSQAAPTTARSSSPYLAEFFGFNSNPAVTPETVLSNSAVAHRCTVLRSELLASVGLHVHRRGRDGGRSRADDLGIDDPQP
jgi:phage portal protein BeeE